MGSADMALDAWSETEARHAITAADMANAIKKSAAAAKNAGFTFNELNGIVAGIGSVTRQSGKEVGTAMRFIARRLFSEKGPKALGEIGIPTITATGENRRGFDILSDLSKQWAMLTNAQKLNVAQSLGGTRQYNALLVGMDNWDEVLDAIEDSTNSKGSAERRNVEIMKTYAKQLEQTRAAATELKMELGKFIFPVFKGGLKALKTVFEFMSAIPTPVKAAGAALTLFFGYAAKGVDIFDKLVEVFGKGKGVIDAFVRSVSKEFDISAFEIFGGKGGPQLEGIKSFAKGVPDALKAAGLDDLHSGFGKLTYVIKEAGMAFNTWAAAGGTSAEEMGKTIEGLGDEVKKWAERTDLFTDVGQLLATKIPGWKDDLTIAVINVMEEVAKNSGRAFELFGKYFGEAGAQFAKFIGDTDPGLLKAITPMAITVGALIPAFKELASRIQETGMTAQDYAQSVYNSRRVQEDQIKNLTTLSRQYDRLQKKVKEVNAVEADPKLKEVRKASDNYTHPLIALGDIQKDATKWANELAMVNNELVLSYDKQGNAILKLSGDYKEYIANLQRASALELAKTDIDVLKRFTQDLTKVDFGESIKNILGTALGEVPGFGPLLKDIVKVSPAKQMEMLTGRLNDLLLARSQNPLSTAFDEDISTLQDALGKLKKIYDGTAKDFNKTLAGIFKFPGASAVDRDTIARLLGDPELLRGFQFAVEVDPVINAANAQRELERALKFPNAPKGTSTLFDPTAAGGRSTINFPEFLNLPEIQGRDLQGATILQQVFPTRRAVIGAAKDITKALLEGSGIIQKEAKKGTKLVTGDIVTFLTQPAARAGIAGQQGVVEVKKNVDGVLEAFVTYYNYKAKEGVGELETKSIDEVADMVEAIFPAGRVQSELENRLENLSTFVTGAAAGIVGLDEKAFKKDFDLGARFYSDISTTTALQGQRGFNFQTGEFGEVTNLQKQWASDTRKYFLEPMEKYNKSVRRFDKAGSLEKTSDASEEVYQELLAQQAVLKNNQVVVQYAAVFADLSKTIEQGTRVLAENIAIEEARQESVKVTSGLLAGLPEGLDNIDTGVRSVQDLTVKQLALLNQPQYQGAAQNFRSADVRRQALIQRREELARAKVAIETITATQQGIGTVIGPDATPEEIKGFIEKSTVLGDVVGATLSKDINNLTKSNVTALDPIATSLEELVSLGQTNQVLTDKIIGLQERVAEFDSRPEDEQGGAEARRISLLIAHEIHKAAGAREGASPRERAVLEERINVLVDTMNKFTTFGRGQAAVGLSPSRLLPGAGLSREEYLQRSFRGLQSNELTERFKTDAGPRTKLGLRGFTALPGVGGPIPIPKLKSIPGFAESDELKQLVAIQEAEKKLSEKTFFNSKNLLKVSAAVAAFQSFSKSNSSAALAVMNEQLVGQKAALLEAKKAGDEGRIATGQSEVAALEKAIAAEQKSLDFNTIVASLANLETGTIALARAFGISETNVKRIGGASLVLYAAMQAASKITGEELPESAKEFGKELGKTLKEVGESGDVSIGTLKDLGSAGKEFKGDFENRVKEITGTTREGIREAFKARLTGLQDLPEAEIEKRAAVLRDEASKGGAGGLKKILAAALASTLAGTFAELTGPGVRKADIERLSEQRGELLDKIASEWPQVAELIITELLDQSKRAQEDLKKPLDSEAQKQALDVFYNAQQALDALAQTTGGVNSEIAALTREMEGNADTMHRLELFEGIRKQVQDFVRDLANQAVQLEVARKYSLGAFLNRDTRGFAGDAQLPLERSGMSTQQRIFASADEDLRGFMTAFKSTQDIITRTEQEIVRLEQLRQKYQEDGVYNQLSALEGMDSEIAGIKSERDELISKQQRSVDEGKMRIHQQLMEAEKKLAEAEKRRAEYAKSAAGENANAAKELDKTIESTKKYADSLANAMNPAVVAAYNGTVLLGEAMFKLNDALTEVSVQDAIDELASIKEFRAKTDKFLGGSGADALQLVDPATRLEAARGGINLKEFDTRRNVEEAEILRAMQQQGQTSELLQRYLSLDSKYEGEARAKEQQKQDERFKRQTDPVLTLMTDLERITRNNNVSPELKATAKAIQEQAGAFLKAAPDEIINAEGKKERRGITVEQIDELTSKFEGLKNSLKEQYGKEFQKMGLASNQELMIDHLSSIAESTRGSKEGLTSVAGYMEQMISKLGDPLEVKVVDSAIKKAAGGAIFGPGGPKDDNIMAMLSSGEFVINQASAAKLGRKNLEYINKYGKLPGLQGGGFAYESEALKYLRSYTPAEQSFVGPQMPDHIAAARQRQAETQKIISLIDSKIKAVQTARENIIGLNKKDIEEGRTPQGVTELIELNKKLLQLQEYKNQLEEAAAERANAHEETRLRLIEENKTGFNKVDQSINVQTEKTAAGQGEIKQSIDAQTGVLTDQTSVLNNIDGGIKALLDVIKSKAPDINRQAFVDKGYDQHEAERLRRIQKVPYTDPKFNVKSIDSRTEHEKRTGRAQGGKVFGEGGPKEDKVPAMLSPGEYVIKAASASKLGMSALEYMNKEGQLPPGMANGGFPDKLVSSREYDETNPLYVGPSGRKMRSAYGAPVSTITGKPFMTKAEYDEIYRPPTKDELKSFGKLATSTVLDASPIVGDVKSAQEAITGIDVITDEKLGPLSRGLAGLAVLPFVPGSIKHLGKSGKALKSLDTAVDLSGSVGKATNKADLAKNIDILNEEFKLARSNHPVAGLMTNPNLKVSTKAKEGQKLTTTFKEGQDIVSSSRGLAKASDLASRRKVVAGGFEHEIGGHVTESAVKKFLKDPSLIGKHIDDPEIAKTLTKERLQKMKDFMDSFIAQPPVSKYAERFTGDASKFGRENFAEFVKLVKAGEIKSPLVEEYTKLFTGFAEGGIMGQIGDWLKTAKEFYFGREVEATEEELAEMAEDARSFSYLTSKDTKKNILDAVDPHNNKGGGGMMKRKHFAEGGMAGRIKDWLKTTKDFFFGRDVEVSEEDLARGAESGRSTSYLTRKETKKNILDAAGDIDSKGMGGMIKKYGDGGKIKPFVPKTEPVRSKEEKEKLKQQLDALKQRHEKKRKIGEFLRNIGAGKLLSDDMKNDIYHKYGIALSEPAEFRGMGGRMKRKHYAEGGIIGQIGEWLKTAKEFYFGREVEATEEELAEMGSDARTFSYLTSKDTKTNILDAIDKKGMGGRMKRKKYAEGGLARRFTEINGEIVELDENGNIVGGLPDDAMTTARRDQGTFANNKAYRVNTGIVDPDPSFGAGQPTARFAELTVQEESKRLAALNEQAFAEKALVGKHTYEEQLAAAKASGNVDVYNQIQAEHAKTIQRENRQALKRDKEVYDALREPGILPAPKGKGLFNYTFDSKTGIVSAEGLSHGVQSKYDLNELAYKERKEAMARGQLPLPTVGPGYEATPGANPGKKLQDTRAKVARAQLVAGISRKAMQGEVDPQAPDRNVLENLYGTAGIGRDTQLAYEYYNKLRYLSENDPNFNRQDELKSLEAMVMSGNVDMNKIKPLMKDIKLTKNFHDVRKKVDENKYGIKDPRLAFLASPHLFKEYVRLKEAGDEVGAAAAKAMLEKAAINAEDIANQFGMAKDAATVDSLAMLYGRFGKGKLEPAELRAVRDQIKIAGQGRKQDFEKETRGFSAREKLGRMFEAMKQGFYEVPKQFYKDTFSSNKSRPVMHNGGVVAQTGTVFAQKGETILPKGFQAGGMVDDNLTRASLTSTTVKIDGSEVASQIADQVKSAIESSEVKVEADAKVRVDTTDAKVPVDLEGAVVKVDTDSAVVRVDTADVTVPVDAAGVASEISNAISQALANATVDVNPSANGSVGADSLDSISNAVVDVQDKLITVKGELEERMVNLESKALTANNVKPEIQSAVSEAMNQVTHDINTNRNNISEITSRVTRFEGRMQYEVGEARRYAQDAQNFATRPGVG